MPKPSTQGSGMSGTPGMSQHNTADLALLIINSGLVKNAIEAKVFLEQWALIATGNNFAYKTLANILFNTAHEGKIPDLTVSIIKVVGFLILNKASNTISDKLSNTLLNKLLTTSQPLINELEHECDFIKVTMTEQTKNMLNSANAIADLTTITQKLEVTRFLVSTTTTNNFQPLLKTLSTIDSQLQSFADSTKTISKVAEDL